MTDNVLISDAQVEDSLHYLNDSAPIIGAARERMIKSEKMTKHRQAILMQRSSHLPVSAQERDARASKQYLEDITEEAKAAGEFETLKARREAATMTLEIWRSMGANQRSARI